jgi:hypothetical protein
MNHVFRLAPLFLCFGILACSEADAPSETTGSEAPSELLILGDDLRQLKDDFNANQGRVRLLFLSGPTCGICLRGMADLNDEFLATRQHDERLVTFVVHVPTLGAAENHARDSIPLLDGPRIHHYWEDSGIIGQHFSEVMDVDMYVWDFWAIYGPDRVWDGSLPPAPDYYEHQLGVSSNRFRGFPRELVLDAGRFAAKTFEFLDKLGSEQESLTADSGAISGEQLADGIFIPKVSQPRNVAITQHIRGRGGYENLKHIQRIEQRGHIDVDGVSYELTTSASRPNKLQRIVTGGGQALPTELEEKLLATFEFDGLFVEWPQKEHSVSMSGMLKIGDILAWRLYMVQHNGSDWRLFVDSHSGALVRKDMLDGDRNVEYSIRQSDFRETSGFMFPHQIEYLDRDGRSLGVEIIDEVDVETEKFDLDNDTVVH